MFCPQCGLQQVSEEVRFCPRCGLSLLPHTLLLAAGSNAAGEPQPPVRTARSVGALRAAKLIFFAAVLFPLALIFSIVIDGPEPLVLPLSMFLAGVVWWSYVRLFGDDSAQLSARSQRRDLSAGAERPALNPQQFVPPPSFGRQQRADTAEMSRPPSVVDHTTKLLDKDS